MQQIGQQKEFPERRRGEDMERRRGERTSGGIGLGAVVGGLVLVGVAALVIANLPDIKRYIKISTM